MKNDGLAESTLKTVSHKLNQISRNANLLNPSEVKTYIANTNVTNATKQKLADSYNYFCQTNDIIWKKPKYKHERKIPTIPTKENIMKVISHARKYAPIFKTLMETGLMPYELSQVKPQDIDFERGILNARGYKGHASRTFKLTQETTAEG